MKNKNLILNICLVIAVLTVITGGILFVQTQKNPDASLQVGVSKDVIGNVTVERNNIGYSLKSDTDIAIDDIIKTTDGSVATVVIGENISITLEESSTVQVKSDSIILIKGAFYSDSLPHDTSIIVDDLIITGEDSLIYTSLLGNIPNVKVYAGEITIDTPNESQVLTMGSSISLSTDKSFIITDLTANDLSDKEISYCVLSEKNIFVDAETLAQITKDRQDHKNIVLEENKKAIEMALSEGTTTIVTGDKSGDINIDMPDSDFEIGDIDGIINEDNEETIFVGIEIECSQILLNIEDLAEGKDKYVPSSGYILSPTFLQVPKGTTVYDILKTICDKNEIPLETQWFPIYDSYYIEGINNLYEFDCGDGSGWLFQVNGWKPNYGVSKYTLEDGDYITLSYTCNY